MGIDLIVTWPNNCDYPLWREWVRENRARFERVIVVFMQANHAEDYSDFVMNAMHQDRVLFIKTIQLNPGGDWRDAAVNTALDVCNAEWVLFTEQDMLIPKLEHEALLDACERCFQEDGHEVFTSMEGEREHPSWLLCRRTTVLRTKRDFGIVPNEHDHFWKFYNDLHRLSIPVIHWPHLAQWHMNGLSHNLTLMQRGEQITYKPFEFLNYLKNTLKVKVPVDDNYGRMATDYILQNE